VEEKTASTNSTAISLPKGGGALRGIGESFQPNLFTGTGNFSIPIQTSAGRDGFGPQLSLQYSTGNGNGLFGLGWRLSIPRITRKTEKGLPRYDTNDVFVLSGAEDLVPKLKDGTTDTIDSEDINNFRITRYLPRTEGLFARIESWEKLDAADGNSVVDVFWRVTTKDNITSIYGRSPQTKIVDPTYLPQNGEPPKIFEWLLEETFDSRGNHISYVYARDDAQPPIDEIYEQDRSYAQVYPRRILYANIPGNVIDLTGSPFTAGIERNGTDHRDPFKTISRRYLMEVVFDYGDWTHPRSSANRYVYKALDSNQELFSDLVPVRTDPFSRFRSGFEIRTLRRCSNVLMIHHFKELGEPTLVKSTDLSYSETDGSRLSLLTSVTLTGYTRLPDGSYRLESMPPVELGYSDFRPDQQRYQAIQADGDNLPATSLNDPNTALVDLFGNGLQDIVQSTPAGFRYWRNRGDARLEYPHVFHESPAGLMLTDAGVGFGDMGGDGLTDLIVNRGAVRGFFELLPEHEADGTLTGGWSPASFRHVDDMPSVDFSDPNLRMLDLTGDGLTDLLITTDREFVWHPSEGEKGYGNPQHVAKSNGLEDIYFNDPSGRVRLADMTGDGLNDIVLVHNGCIDYWPNLGYGRFGKRLTMGGDTRLPPSFNPKRLFLADLDGSGIADLVYVDFNEVHFWFNQSGNRWSEKKTIHGTPITLDTTSLSFTDFLGIGTTCLLWSYDFGTVAGSNLKLLDFCGGEKPYLLTEMRNNIGARTRVRYAPSTKFYLQDAAQGNFWATPLPFPVQVVDKTESIDHVGKTKLVTQYRYHHGFYDGREREFRGFGRVDQIDTESFEEFESVRLHGSEDIDNANQAHHVPAVETRTWFHTGAYFEQRNILERYQAEYLSGIDSLDSTQRPRDPDAFEPGEHIMEVNDADPVAEAHRALRGAVLRTEVYAHNTSAEKNFPYRVTENTYRVQSKQHRGTNPHAVYLTTARRSISYHYERRHNGRDLIDPRIQQQITIDVDEFGNPTLSADIAYRRRQPQFSEQDQDLIAITSTTYVTPVETRSDFLHSRVAKTMQYEITGVGRSADKAYTTDDLATAFAAAQEIAYEEQPTAGQLQKRKLNHRITMFWNGDLSDAEPIGGIAYHGLPYETYQLALTPSLRRSIFGINRLTHAMGVEGGYRRKSGHQWQPAGPGDWWIPSGVQIFDPARFFLPVQSIDPFGNATAITYDPYFLFPIQTTDALDNFQEALIDYRVLQPYLVRDINGNYSEVAFSGLGLVAGTALMGKAGRDPSQTLLGVDDNEISAMRANTEADSLESFEPDLPIDTIKTLMTDPDGDTNPAYEAITMRQVLKKASSRIIYDMHRYRIDASPAGVCSIAREIHHADAGNASPLQLTYSYTDGFGRSIQTKRQAEPGNDAIRRWVVSGWAVFNNKGKPVEQFEPFFSDHPDFEPNRRIGVSATLFYDPLQRVVCTLHPDQTYEKIRFDPWQQTAWDRNDTVLLDPRIDPDVKDYVNAHISGLVGFETWYHQRIPDPANLPGSLTARQQAAEKAAAHANTPTVSNLDVQGNPFLVIASSNTETFETRFDFDIEGHDLKITDPRGVDAFVHHFDMADRKLRIDSRDAGLKRLLPAVDGQSLVQWDADDNRVSTRYDALRRPIEVQVRKTSGAHFLVEKRIYGESRPQPASSNSRGAVWKIYDGAGVAVNETIDFKGNLTGASRRLLANGRNTEVQWPVNAAGEFDEPAAATLLEILTRLDTANYTLSTQYDALNRITQARLPDGTLQTPSYNPAGLLESLSVKHSNQGPEQVLTSIDYNAKGQRETIEYANGVVTTYNYEPSTFRLKSLESTRNAPSPKRLQQLHYTYDPVGNITSIRDEAHATVFNHNQAVDPESRYTYDALNRLIEASGREHEAMTACRSRSWGKKHTVFLPFPQPATNAQALINYREKYQYDRSGNIERIEHINALRTTIRHQTYDGQSNRILSSTAGCLDEGQSIDHDRNGNITWLPHLHELVWDFKNQLIEVELNQGPTPNRAYYQYDSQGRRVRKTVVKNSGSHVSERIYLGGFEIYVETVSNTVQTHRESIHVMDDKNRVAIIERERDPGDLQQITSRTIRFQLGNHLGSATVELDGGAQWISYEEYYPYGGTAYMAGRNLAETSLKRYRYSGKERDDETGMYYYGARYYLPWMGRWISCDPIGNADGLNLYQFVRGSPIVNSDEVGTESSSESIIPMIDMLSKPGDVGQWWGRQKADPDRWAGQLAKDENTYLDVFSSDQVPDALKIGGGKLSPDNLNFKQIAKARELFGESDEAFEKFANYENRRRIISHYVRTHPATSNYLLQLYRTSRDSSIVLGVAERGYQIVSGKEAFTGKEISRIRSGFELILMFGLGALGRKSPPAGHLPPLGKRGAAPPVPPGVVKPRVTAGKESYSLAAFGDAIKWGTGSDTARARMATVTLEEIKQLGLTRQLALEWAEFYRGIATESLAKYKAGEIAKVNPSAAGRADLMEHIANMLSPGKSSPINHPMGINIPLGTEHYE
jgi:RHS repeat-associated protein